MNSIQVKIANRMIGLDQPVFIVAEISANHHQRYEEAVALVNAAKEAGADAVKLQTYTPDTITINSDKKWFRVGGDDNPDGWKGKTLYELYKTAYTPWEWQPKLKKIADGLDLILFSTPFDESAVDFLEAMNVPCYKVASYEINDLILLKKVARTGKPVIISLGYASLEDAELAISTLRKNGAKDIAALHCVTGYSEEPPLEDMNLKTIQDIRDRFDVLAGFSDNNAGIEIPLMSAKAGALIIEKHFILNRSLGGPDARFSLEPDEMKEMVSRLRKGERVSDEAAFERALGSVQYGPKNELERYNKRWMRSLFAVADIKKGERFSRENVRSIRPADGLHTKYFEEILGTRAVDDVERGTPLSWNLIERGK